MYVHTLLQIYILHAPQVTISKRLTLRSNTQESLYGTCNDGFSLVNRNTKLTEMDSTK